MTLKVRWDAHMTQKVCLSKRESSRFVAVRWYEACGVVSKSYQEEAYLIRLYLSGVVH
nr:hypothetical protein Q903MT_gene2043 [Picea sitchensis]